MAKKSTGLGKGLDSLIPDFYDEDFDSNSAVSLEDMLGEDEKQEESNEDIVENVDEEGIHDSSVGIFIDIETDETEYLKLRRVFSKLIEEIKRYNI